MAQVDKSHASRIERLDKQISDSIHQLDNKYSPQLAATARDLDVRMGSLEGISQSIINQLAELRESKAGKQQCDELQKELTILGDSWGDQLTRRARISDPEPSLKRSNAMLKSPSRLSELESEEAAWLESQLRLGGLSPGRGVRRSLSEARLHEARLRASSLGRGSRLTAASGRRHAAP